jgi:ankyrin repeat protein
MADNRERARHTVAGQKYDRIRRNKKDRNSALKDQSISIGERLIVAAMKYAVEIEYNRGAEIRWLIKQGANPDYKSERGGWHAMHFVSYNGSIDGVRALLDKNASVNVSNDDGTTPLHLACASGNRDVASALLDAGAMLNVQSGRRITWPAPSLCCACGSRTTSS